MKRKLLLMLTTVILLILSSCTPVKHSINSIDQYESFKMSVGQFIEDYTSETYKFISPEQLVVTMYGLPNSEIDSIESDSINNANYTTLLDMYFTDKDEEILIKANFMFLPSELSNQFIGANIVSNDTNGNILEEYHGLQRDNYSEFIIYYENTLITLNFFDLSKGDYINFADLTVKFYNEFEALIIKVFKKD